MQNLDPVNTSYPVRRTCYVTIYNRSKLNTSCFDKIYRMTNVINTALNEVVEVTLDSIGMQISHD